MSILDSEERGVVFITKNQNKNKNKKEERKLGKGNKNNLTNHE